MKIYLSHTLIIRETVCLVILLLVIGSCSPSIMKDKSSDHPHDGHDWQTIEKQGESLEYSIYEDQDRFVLKLRTQSRNLQARILAFGLTVKIGTEKKNQSIFKYPIGLFEVRYFDSPQQLLTFWERTQTSGIYKARLNRIENIAYLQGINEQEGYVMKDSISQVDLSYFLNKTEFIYELDISKRELGHQELISKVGIDIGHLDVGHRYPSTRFSEMRYKNNYSDHISKLGFKWEIWISGNMGDLIL